MPALPRNRSSILQALLAQQAQPPQRISSYGQLAAELGAQYLRQRQINKSGQQQDEQTKSIVDALMGGQGGGQPGGNPLPPWAIDEAGASGVIPPPSGGQQGDPRQALMLALQSPDELQNNPMLAQLLMGQMQGPEMMNVPQGGAVVDPRTMREVYSNRGPLSAKPPQSRVIQRGGENVTEEWDDSTQTWNEIGRGSRTQVIEQRTGELPRTTGADLAGKMFAAYEGLDRLKAIGGTFKDEYLTLGGKLSAKVSKWKDVAGMELKPDEQQFLQGYTSFASNALNNLNLYIKEITGAAMTNAESDRIRQALPDPQNDSPTEFRAKYNTTIKTLQRAVTRSKLALLSNKPIESFSLDKVDSLIDERGEELENQFVASGMTREEAEAAVRKKLQEEFGL